MTIRSKLLFFYGLTAAAVIGSGLTSTWSMLRWKSAGDNLAGIQRQSLKAERIRAGVSYQINYALDYLDGDTAAEDELHQLEKQVAERIQELKDSTTDNVERDHIGGMEETRLELMWMIERIFDDSTRLSDRSSIGKIQVRLRETAIELADEISVLNQFYRSKVNLSNASAVSAGILATRIAIGTGLLILIQLIGLIFLTQRWLVQPIRTVKDATLLISEGKLNTRVKLATEDEWGELADSVNQMARSLQALQLELRTRERLTALGEVAAYTAHNIQNPLAGIRASAQVSLKENNLSERVTESFEDIIRSVDQLSGWIRRFLDFARPLEMKKQEVCLTDVVERAVQIIKGRIESSGVSIVKSFEGTLPSIQMDSILIEQSICSIINNSIDAGSSRIDLKIIYENLSVTDSWLVLTIADDGQGFSEEMKERAFLAFATNKKEGTGLGLAQAKKIVNLHGGELSLDDSVKSGAAVVISFPVNSERSAK